jgi:hypothetical protein
MVVKKLCPILLTGSGAKTNSLALEPRECQTLGTAGRKAGPVLGVSVSLVR